MKEDDLGPVVGIHGNGKGSPPESEEVSGEKPIASKPRIPPRPAGRNVSKPWVAPWPVRRNVGERRRGRFRERSLSWRYPVVVYQIVFEIESRPWRRPVRPSRRPAARARRRRRRGQM